MVPYANRSGESGVEAYENGPDCITVRFRNGTHRHYLYDHNCPGPRDVAKMKELAAAGLGLNGYIKTSVGTRFARKW